MGALSVTRITHPCCSLDLAIDSDLDDPKKYPSGVAGPQAGAVRRIGGRIRSITALVAS